MRNEDDHRVVSFRVDRTWRGDIPGRPLPDNITVATGNGGGDCGFDFDRGRQYVVYADRHGYAQQLSTGICTRTRRVEDAAEDLSYFAAMEAGTAAPSRLSGQLHGFGDHAPPPPVAGIPIEVRSTSELRTTTTDASGHFELTVPPGLYDVSARVPDTYAPARYTELIYLADRTACMNVDLTARWDGRLVGTVVDTQGSPASGIELDLRKEGSRYPIVLSTDHIGRFTFVGLGPGRYSIGINLRERTNALEAPVVLRTVVLGPGQRLELGTLTIGPR